MTTGSKVAVYARVSTREQTAENQLLALRDYAKLRGWEIVHEYVDTGISGAKESRPELNKLMEAARRRLCDIVLVWRFDRFARSSRHLLNTLAEFQSLGVEFVSFGEAVDTTTPAGKMVFTMVSAIGEFERSLIKERVMAGLQRARAQGKKLGRPKVQVDDVRIADLRQQGLSIRQISRELAISKDVVARALSRNRGQNRT